MGKTSKVLPADAAIFVVDPGKVTGCAMGVFPWLADWIEEGQTVWDIMKWGVDEGAIETWEEEGTVEEQQYNIRELFIEFVYTANVEGGTPLNAVSFVIEDFALRTVHADLTPVRLTEVLEGSIRATGNEDWIVKQTASAAKGYATNQRLKENGLWVRGSTHRRDAMRHLAKRVSVIVS